MLGCLLFTVYFQSIFYSWLHMSVERINDNKSCLTWLWVKEFGLSLNVALTWLKFNLFWLEFDSDLNFIFLDFDMNLSSPVLNIWLWLEYDVTKLEHELTDLNCIEIFKAFESMSWIDLTLAWPRTDSELMLLDLSLTLSSLDSTSLNQ